MAKFVPLLNALRDVLQGEPLRFIGYGAIAVVVVISQVAVLLGYSKAAPDLDTIIVAVGGAVAFVTELARKYVYSPNSVAAIVLGVELGTIPPIPAPGDVPAATSA
jgi:hypothetical protein